MTLETALKNVTKLSDEDLIAAHQGADFAKRGNAHDRREAAKWQRIAAKFYAEIKRRRAA